MTDDQEPGTPVTSGELVSVPEVSGEWLPPPAAADRLGMSERTLWRLVKQGRYQKRVEHRRAEILVPVTVTGATQEHAGNALAVPDRPSDTMSVALVQELKDQRQQDATEIRLLRERNLELEREVSALRERTLPWHLKLKRWLTGA